MTPSPARLELAEELFKTCNFRSCKQLAIHVLTCAGVEQLFCCWDCGQVGIEADRVKTGALFGREKAATKEGRRL